MSDEVEMRQAKCRQDYMAIVKQSRQLIEKLDAKNEPKKRQKRSKNSEKEKAVAPSSSKKMDREELEKTIRGFLKELDSTEAAPMRTTGCTSAMRPSTIDQDFNTQ
uniref:Uncharacterized protein n=1 Tax=Oryza rufipogon TaxID=4529 RepID=A0A0E0NI26_ORYRU